MSRRLSSLAATACALATLLQGAQAENFLSKESIRLGCSGADLSKYMTGYVQGVVEMWFLRDIRREADGVVGHESRSDAYCKRVHNVSASEWARMVCEDISQARDGLGVIAVIGIRHKRLC
jgi:hypothetical protein